MQHVFIINPTSGRQDPTQGLLPRIQQAAKNTGEECLVEITAYPGHAVELAARYGKSGEKVRLYACGGDGTLNEVFNGAYPFPNVQVAHIPCGSGNDFIRNFGMEEQFINLGEAMRGEAAPIDLMMVNGRICAAIASTGLDAQVAYGIPTFRRLPLCGGQMAYNLSIAQQLLGKMGKRFTVEIDGIPLPTGEYLLAAVCNGAYYGGGYCAAPNSSLEDGLLDFVLVNRISRLKIASVLSLYKKGGHVTSQGKVAPGLEGIISVHRASRIGIYPAQEGDLFVVNADGECFKAPYLEARVLPKAGQFVLPQPAAAQWKKQKQQIIV